MNLNFHQTFKPEKKHITELILLSGTNPSMTVEEISLATGIPTGLSSGKVVPHIEYAKFMGLIDYTQNNGKYNLSLTKLGKAIVEEDVSLSENLTLILLHAMLIRENRGADLWSFCFFKYAFKYGKKSNISIFENEAKNYFSPNINLSPLRGCYEEFFHNLNILNFDKKNNIIQFNDLGYDSQFEYLYAYILYEYWEIKYPNSNEISSVEFEKLNFGSAFCWTKKEESEILEKLSEKRLIRLNKQLSPYTILKITSKENLIDKLFDDML